MIGYTLFTVAMAVSIACLTYSGVASRMHWPIGEILSRDKAFPKLVAFVTIPYAGIKSAIVYQWWSSFVVLLIGWMLALMLTILMKQKVQYLCILGAVPVFLLTVLYASEAQPLGIISRLLFKG